MQSPSPIVRKFYARLLYVMVIFLVLLSLLAYILAKQLQRTTEILEEKNNLTMLERQQQEIGILEARIKNRLTFLGNDPLSAITALNQQLAAKIRPANLDNIRNLMLTEANKQKVVINLNVVSDSKRVDVGFMGGIDTVTRLLDLLRREQYAFTLDRLDLKKANGDYLINFSLTFQ